MWFEFSLSLLLGYLLGSIPFSQITAKLVKNIDLRQVGSKNVGGMNTMHNIGLGWGLLAGSMDVLKGAAALSIAELLGVPFPFLLWAGLAALLGHNWPLWLDFKGGKGIATILGISAWLAFPETLLGFIIGLITYFVSRRNISLTALAGFITIVAAMVYRGRPNEMPMLILGCIAVMIAASMPSGLELLRKQGGIKAYLQNPRAVYEQDFDHLEDA